MYFANIHSFHIFPPSNFTAANASGSNAIPHCHVKIAAGFQPTPKQEEREAYMATCPYSTGPRPSTSSAQRRRLLRRLLERHGGRDPGAPAPVLRDELGRELVQLLAVRLLPDPPPLEQHRLDVPLLQHLVRRRQQRAHVRRGRVVLPVRTARRHALPLRLNAQVVGRAALPEGARHGVVDEVGGAVGGNEGDGARPLLGTPPVHAPEVRVGGGSGAPAGAAADGEHEEVLDAAHEWELVFVVEHVRDGGRGRAAHGGPAVYGGAGRGPIHRHHLGGLEATGLRPRRAADLAEAEVVALVLQGVGAREHQRRGRLEVVAGDEHGLDGVPQGELLAERRLHGHLQRRRRRGQRPLLAAAEEGRGARGPAEQARRMVRHEPPRVVGVEQWRAARVRREQHRREHAARAGPGDEVEVVRDTGIRVPRRKPERGLQVRQRAAGEQRPQPAPAAVHAQHADLPPLRRLPGHRRRRGRLLRRLGQPQVVRVGVPEQELALEDREYLVVELVRVGAPRLRLLVQPLHLHLLRLVHALPFALKFSANLLRSHGFAKQQGEDRISRGFAKIAAKTGPPSCP
uniref:Uncharacterized protein n=1 Tax=Arundo donax TaxID=35708 RepID=A0A0A9DAB5_ARUDO